MRIKIKVVPNSDRDEVIEGDPLIVRVRDMPVKGKANRAVIKLLSKHFNSRVRIVSGAKSKEKIVEVKD
ncbi:MAG: DUF167 domain-containing protein [Candidatus Thermoplasmatota archaeon]|nr:DUF167 domain-containing protein [Candidatus Thermoplasmatota archaeon]